MIKGELCLNMDELYYYLTACIFNSFNLHRSLDFNTQSKNTYTDFCTCYKIRPDINIHLNNCSMEGYQNTSSNGS